MKNASASSLGAFRVSDGRFLLALGFDGCGRQLIENRIELVKIHERRFAEFDEQAFVLTRQFVQRRAANAAVFDGSRNAPRSRTRSVGHGLLRRIIADGSK